VAFEPSSPHGLPPEGVRSARFIVGMGIIFLGAIFLFDSLGWIESRDVLRYVWPLILVGIGVSIVSRRHGRRRHGWILIIIGAWIFLAKIGVLDFHFWGFFFPGILLFVGGMLVYRSLKPPRLGVTFDPKDAPPGSPTVGDLPPLESESDADAQARINEKLRRKFAGSTLNNEDDHAEYIRSFAVLSGSEMRPMSRPFRGADLSAMFGGVKLDLTSARMEGDSARIEVLAFCGGIEIHVPPDWTVTSRVATLLGGFSDKRRPTTTIATKTLIVDGFAVMGGIEVKN
jgi:predicted membrane protein